MASSVSPEERLLNLVVALIATDQGLTKPAIFGSVSGYRESIPADDRESAALERMFERDKKTLRDLGVPVEAIGELTDPNDMHDARYRIPRAEYVLPDDIVFSPEELAVLQVAGSAWSSGSMSEAARSGLRKISALGNAVDEPILGFSPRVSVRDAAFAPLRDAVERAVEVTFAYLRPGDPEARIRRVRPLALVEFEGRWHLQAIDTRVDAVRTYLLSRVVGDVALTDIGFDASLRDGAGERALRDLEEFAQRNVGHVEVHPETEAALRLGRRATPAAQGLLVPYVDLHIFAEELASYGPEVRVVAPAALRDAVMLLLRGVADRHATQNGAARG